LLLRSFGWQATALLLMASIANLSQFAKKPARACERTLDAPAVPFIATLMGCSSS